MEMEYLFYRIDAQSFIQPDGLFLWCTNCYRLPDIYHQHAIVSIVAFSLARLLSFVWNRIDKTNFERISDAMCEVWSSTWWRSHRNNFKFEIAEILHRSYPINRNPISSVNHCVVTTPLLIGNSMCRVYTPNGASTLQKSMDTRSRSIYHRGMEY